MLRKRLTAKKQTLNKRRFVGDLCKRKHQAPGVKIVGSVRFSNCKTCCTCNALSVVRRKAAHKKYRDDHKEDARIYQEQYLKDNRERKLKYYRKYYRDVIKPREEAKKRNAETT